MGTARRYASAVYVCPSVCLSVCLSQVGVLQRPPKPRITHKFWTVCYLFAVSNSGLLFGCCRAVALLPSEVEQRLGGRRDFVVRPRNEVELGNGACFVRLQVLEVETANDVVFAPDVFRDQVNLFTIDNTRLHRSSHHRHHRSKKGIKFSHTRYRALCPELIPVYRQSARR